MRGPKCTVRNIAATINFNTSVDLEKLTLKNGFKQDKLRLFASIIWMDMPKASALVFAKGKAVIVGATNENQALLATTRLYRLLKSQFPEIQFTEYTITNILATGSFGAPIDLPRLSREQAWGTIYHPDKFPGLSFNIKHPSGKGQLTANVFLGGAVVIAGACTLQDMRERLGLLWALIGRYLITDPAEKEAFIKKHPNIEKSRKKFMESHVDMEKSHKKFMEKILEEELVL